jgi:hypothetical protein
LMEREELDEKELTQLIGPSVHAKKAGPVETTVEV